MTYSQVSKAGAREINEDKAVCVQRDGNYCFAVADGLGAHGKGEAAAGILAGVFDREFGLAHESNSAFLARVFNMAQAEIISSRRKADEMKTTCVALSIIGGRYLWGHIGDSRLYYFHKGKLRKRTLDHSVPQMLVLSGEIGEDDIRRHPDRGKLLRAMGDDWDVRQYELSKEKRISKNDAFLLCTDGFWEYISDEMIARALKDSGDASGWLEAMLSVVEENGGNHSMDNYTAITVIA